MKIKMSFMALLIIIFFLHLSSRADSGEYIVKLKNTAVPNELTEFLTVVNKEHRIYITNNIKKLSSFNEYIEYKETNDKVSLIEGQDRVSLCSLDQNEISTEKWQLQMVNAAFAWKMRTYGNKVNVAVIDTGCNPHEDINLAGGYNFVLNNDDYSDNKGHGTHVAGIISALHNKIGIEGIAPKVNIYALKCVDQGYSSGVDELIAAIYAAVDKYNCKVISMSLGIPNNNEGLYNAVKYATDNGAIIVAAAGNDGGTQNESRYWYPAAYTEVIGVGSVGMTKRRSDFSQQNDSVFVVAPGEKYKSAIGLTEYAEKDGTSQATPIVAASAAILLSADKDMTVDEFKNYIKTCSEPLEDDFCGYGLLNIEAMFKECIKNTDYYISPINEDGVLIYNNTGKVLNAVGIFAEYKGKRYISSIVSDITLLANEQIMIDCKETNGYLKFFLWNFNKSLIPLAERRE